MPELDHTIRMKRSALVVRGNRPQPELMTATPDQYWALRGEAVRQARRGRIQLLWETPRWRDDEQVWAILVRPLKPRPPAWRKPVLITTLALVALAALFGTGWWLLTALTQTALGAFCGAALGVLTALAYAGRRSRTHVSVRVDVR